MLSFRQILSNLECWVAESGSHLFVVMEDSFQGNFIAFVSDQEEYEDIESGDIPPPHIIGRGFENANSGKAECERFAKDLRAWPVTAANDG